MAPAAIAFLAAEAPVFLKARGAPLADPGYTGKAVVRHLWARQTAGKDKINPGQGVIDPHDISNTGIFVLFGFIGASMVLLGIWFFFWAKNGGFYWKETDWDDYKSTIFGRNRRGPNGTVISGATESTMLGGGSAYKEVDDDKTVITETTALSGITGGVSDASGRARRKAERERRARERAAQKKREKSRYVGNNGVVDDDAKYFARQELRNYRAEKAARVGGMNKESDASTWDGSTVPSEVSASLMNNQEPTPTSSPTKPSGNKGGIRKVYSTADRNADREAAQLRAEARRMEREQADRKGTSTRDLHRNYSYQRARSSVTSSTDPSSRATGASGRHSRSRSRNVPDRVVEEEEEEEEEDELISDTGTKSYYHPIPELRTRNQQPQESQQPLPSNDLVLRSEEQHCERREARRSRPRKDGYRRGRTEDY